MPNYINLTKSRFLIFLVIATLIAIPHNIGAAQTTTVIESDAVQVQQSGRWTRQTTSAASGGAYLYSSKSENDVLTLPFAGPSIEVLYITGPSLGTLAIEIDGTVLRTVITTANKTTYGQSARIDYLNTTSHTLKVYAQAGGIIAIDAFRIPPTVETATPAAQPTEPDGGVLSSTCAPLNVTHRVSLNSLGAQGPNNSGLPTISSDGRFVAMESSSPLVPADNNSSLDIYVYDRQTCTVQLISVSASGGIGNASSVNPSISANGRYVVYESGASNLVTGDTNALTDLFAYDRQTGSTTRVSVDSGFGQATGGISYNPAISADGRYIAFESTATNLVAGDTNNLADVFARDTQSALTFRVSISDGEAQATGGSSSNPAISADGRYIAFGSTATNLVAGDTNGETDIFVRDTQTGSTTRISVDSNGTQAVGGSSLTPSVSQNGRFIAFHSASTNLVAGDTNGEIDVFVRDTQSNTTTRVSVSSGGTQAIGGPSVFGLLSADGRYIAFRSGATNLVAGDTNGFNDMFVHDTQTNTTTRISVSSEGTQAVGGNATAPAISADGRYIVYESGAINLVIGDTNGAADVFVSPRAQPVADALALFNPAFNYVSLINTLQDNPPYTAYTAFSAYAPITGGTWVMGDWNGDGLDTPGVYANGPFFYTNKSGESQPSDWRSLWIGIAGPPVAGRFNGSLPNDCIGAVQQATLSGLTVFVLYFTCDLSGTTLPVISNQWLSAVLPDSGGFSGTHQFGAGDFNGDGVDSIAVRRGTFIAFGNVPPTTNAAAFDLAQFIGTPSANDAGIFVVGDWDANGADSFGLFYQNGELFYRNDLTFNSGVYVNQSVGTPFGNSGVQVTTWR